MTTNTSNCSQALQVFDAIVYQFAQPLILIVDTCAILLNIVVIGCFISIRNYHVNVRILLSMLSVACIPGCVAQSLRVVNAWRSGNSCATLLKTFNDCEIKQTLITSYNSMILLSVMLAIDRSIGTLKHRSYEGLKWHIGVALSVVAIAIGILIGQIGKGKAYVAPDGAYFPFCAAVSDTMNYSLVLMAGVDVAILIFALLAYCKLIAVNRRMIFDYVSNQAHFTLASRLQLKHNIEVTETLLPSVILSCVTWTVMLSIFLITLYVVPPSLTVVKFIYWPYIDLYVGLYMLAMPAITIYKNEKVRSILRGLIRATKVKVSTKIAPKRDDRFCTLPTTGPTPYSVDTQVYFGLLQQTWLKGREADRTLAKGLQQAAGLVIAMHQAKPGFAWPEN